MRVHDTPQEHFSPTRRFGSRTYGTRRKAYRPITTTPSPCTIHPTPLTISKTIDCKNYSASIALQILSNSFQTTPPEKRQRNTPFFSSPVYNLSFPALTPFLLHYGTNTLTAHQPTSNHFSSHFSVHTTHIYSTYARLVVFPRQDTQSSQGAKKPTSHLSTHAPPPPSCPMFLPTSPQLPPPVSAQNSLEMHSSLH